MKVWFEILSEFFVNLSVVWFALVFIEPQISPSTNLTLLGLISRLIAGILSLIIAKRFREESMKNDLY